MEKQILIIIQKDMEILKLTNMIDVLKSEIKLLKKSINDNNEELLNILKDAENESKETRFLHPSLEVNLADYCNGC